MQERDGSEHNTDISVIKNDMEYIKRDISDIKNEVKLFKEYFKNNFVTQNEFKPVRNVVYGMIAMILAAVIGALLAVVVQ